MKALLVVDVQNDFCPGGALAVPNGNEIVQKINKLRKNYDLVIFTLDTHPTDHCSFKDQGGMWPVHCVTGTTGHKLHKDLIVQKEDLFVQKGMNSKFDSYSGFKDDGGEKTILTTFIEDFKIEEVDICGLASEFCVAFTAQDARSYNLKTTVILDACKCISKEAEIEAFTNLAGIGVDFKESFEV